MQPDYPAAHSMDSVWFAVDADGHVAAFSTGEDGHIPSEGNGGYGWEVLREMETLTNRPENVDEELETQCKKLGLFLYDFGDAGDPVEPYSRYAVPAEPLHVDQLPAALRERVRQAVFPDVCFHQAERIQPFESYAECDGYRMDDMTGYLCADGRTVKPIPGAEEHFQEWAQNLREKYPAVADHFVFEGPSIKKEATDAEE